jgi:hypothetical protein
MAGPLRNNPRTERAQRARMRGRRSPRTSRGGGLLRASAAQSGVRNARSTHAWGLAEPATHAWRRGGRASVAQPAHGTRAARTHARRAESANLARRRVAPGLGGVKRSAEGAHRPRMRGRRSPGPSHGGAAAGPLSHNRRTERALHARMHGGRSPRTSRGGGLPRASAAQSGVRNARSTRASAACGAHDPCASSR